MATARQRKKTRKKEVMTNLRKAQLRILQGAEESIQRQVDMSTSPPFKKQATMALKQIRLNKTMLTKLRDKAE